MKHNALINFTDFTKTVPARPLTPAERKLDALNNIRETIIREWPDGIKIARKHATLFSPWSEPAIAYYTRKGHTVSTPGNSPLSIRSFLDSYTDPCSLLQLRKRILRAINDKRSQLANKSAAPKAVIPPKTLTKTILVYSDGTTEVVEPIKPTSSKSVCLTGAYTAAYTSLF